MEHGVARELWVGPWREGDRLEAPWDQRAPDWSGTPDGPLEITLPAR